MDGASVNHQAVDYHDVQGLLRFGYGKLAEARYALLRFNDVDAARRWLDEAPVASAVALPSPPSTALQIAITAQGLEALGVPASVRRGFSAEFLGGMADESRARRLGDTGRNAPSEWAWGGRWQPHLLVMFFTQLGGLERFIDASTGPLWGQAFEPPHWLETANLDNVEPFGFADGISQPAIDWQGERDAGRAARHYGEPTALGEFLLGYPNEYEKYTERPLLDADATTSELLSAGDDPAKKDLGLNGSYLVIRTLSQDVRRFWQDLVARAGGLREAQALAEKMVGRTLHGDPLVPSQGKNGFTYDGDRDGHGCPLGAHIRRANPRNADLPHSEGGLKKLIASFGLGRDAFRDDLISAVRFHRVLRRGREFGSGLSPDDALQPPPADEGERGLHFICLNASIARQFEFLQSAWIANTKFAGLTGESDPLLGTRESIPGCPATADFTWREGETPRRAVDLPQYVTIRGGAYFFLPSRRALRYIARARSL